MKITEHFDSDEFACHDRRTDPPTITPYPLDEPDGDGTWQDTRLTPLCSVLEVVREAGGNEPIEVDSGFRTLSYDEALYEASAKDGTVAPASRSQHPKGRAADVKHARLRPHELFNLVISLYEQGKIPALGGIGLYPSFVHLDVRPKIADHLSVWGANRPSNVL